MTLPVPIKQLAGVTITRQNCTRIAHRKKLARHALLLFGPGTLDFTRGGAREGTRTLKPFGTRSLVLAKIAARNKPRQLASCLEYIACNDASMVFRRSYGVHSTNACRQACKVRRSTLVEEFIAEAKEIQYQNRLAEECRRHNYLELMRLPMKLGRRRK
jgi:hypothetical protein